MVRGAAVLCAVVIAINVLSCGPRDPRPGTVKDEAMRAGVAPEKLVLPTPDYFRDMDFNNPPPKVSQSEIEGRNMWMVWTGGNDHLWNRLTVDSLGTFDLLKTISSHPPSCFRSWRGATIPSMWARSRRGCPLASSRTWTCLDPNCRRPNATSTAGTSSS